MNFKKSLVLVGGLILFASAEASARALREILEEVVRPIRVTQPVTQPVQEVTQPVVQPVVQTVTQPVENISGRAGSLDSLRNLQQVASKEMAVDPSNSQYSKPHARHGLRRKIAGN